MNETVLPPWKTLTGGAGTSGRTTEKGNVRGFRCGVMILVFFTAAMRLGAQTPGLAEQELIRKLSRVADSLSREGAFSGLIVLTRGGVVVFETAHGFADREAGVLNTVETAFNLGSINKMFTSTAIRQLSLRGKLNIDSTLAHCWPDYPNQDVARKVTIRQLLNHQSGVGGNIFAAPAGGTRSDIRHNRDIIPLIAGEPLQFEPGTDRRYSNAGYVILGGVVERVSGEDYYDYVQKHIYEVAGMTRTAHYYSDSLPPATAVGYTHMREAGLEAEALARNTALLPGRGSAAGGGYSTAGDLVKWMTAIREGRVPGAPPSGLGVAGGAPGLNAVLEGDLPGGFDLIVLSNLDPPAAETVATHVRRWLGAAE